MNIRIINIVILSKVLVYRLKNVNNVKVEDILNDKIYKKFNVYKIRRYFRV